MKFVPISSPDGRDLGWISPELIVSIDPSGRYIKYRDGDEVRNATVPYGMSDDLILRACGILPKP